ncbi:MAG: Chromosome segregation ATPase-like protein [Candidatus Uhrbacteria bacterium GW2011_GWD2_41_121]|uniref:Chromosome segregation ATPase-like protein n=1 Tax=Candidatus Uhrbacteria bacterium GW2011_GWC1_41_20 TaxID=1618983 RepID=A0A0G0XNS4_9BACT|nr:MAG: Chromosome segregation ATPase-like protein [Candidatus Uhrbacteria bacterium GW2011_GWE1_39_46]KKR63705.1 MAG: Chromosome segregation ATPase-like protein [Candidatus Uhrbacteria bacterium GW2011_GWC2_40_450]KKR89351.1 MAG: Chromosome segregation ATPase-like protein [Candidatus Uhrbacteria bacterium GW2011_GWE2_41_1153]KKR89793.1 MAG: Chromosome segregation ATPase-like protein [Candidatus Uhrbacteria bacterium GW2011_GWD2_41_121]KKR95663.1 MAG: Chromosome segregation ATPase-like protein 
MEEIKKKLLEHDIRFDAHDARFDAHDARFDAHDARFDAHDKRFDAHDKRFDEHDARFDAIDKRFDSIDGQIDFLAQKMIEHDEDIKEIKATMATKQDLAKLKSEILEPLDEMITLMKKRDEEMTMQAHGIQRLNDRDDKIDARITSLHPLAV